ncbi:PREDICTED: uncharacterized protein LOC105451790 [Wasmannia auropunctata]|uniref:uncharacterized protein LOC105451790 n=1 Tax=Wasmannia auropunctata TaxID=64793 RepID=UPI0005EFFEDA|nr:PREDICTED: uncharacterized protein LOC105451790 [Wasmannia auropunctata]
MKKRKVLIEENSEHKESFARPSVASLRSATASHHRRSRSVKSPSVQNLHNSSDKFAGFKDDKMVLLDEMKPPKTRFNSGNRSKEARSTSSPRLKSFPAEVIKKQENPPMFSPEPIAALIVQQDPRETGTFYNTNSSGRNNNGHGDVISIPLPPHQPPKLQNMCSTSQQQIVANHPKICQTNPQSESWLTRRIVSPERQTHRPFVPNIVQGTVYDRSIQRSPAIINQPVITQIPSTQVAMSQTQGSLSDSQAIVDQTPNTTKPSVLDNQCQQQLVNDRNAANHRQMFVQMPQQKQAMIAQNASMPLNNQRVGKNIYPQFHAPFQQNLQQINQQHSAYHQQMMPQPLNQMQLIPNQQQHIHNSGTHYSYYNQQLPVAQVSGQGMTSPQDMTVNQMRFMRHNLPIHQNHGHPVSFQPAWPQNDRWMQIANQNQQQLHQQIPPQWQYYYQTRDSNVNQQNAGGQDQSNPSQIQANHKPVGQTAESHAQREEKKKLQFTSDMIRDQELLVSAMRQQGIPEEVMRRQFDALLNEQRRHLAYVAQFRQQEADIPEEIKRTRLARRRADKDEKPEWMVHITPPRISYSDFERIKAQQRVLNEQYLTDDKSSGKINKIVADEQRNYNQSNNEEICNQVSPQQMYVNPYQLWQANNWPHRNDNQTLCGHTACYPYNHPQNANTACRSLNPTFKYGQYNPYNVRYNPYFPHSQPQEVWLKEHNPSHPLNQNDDRRTSMDPAYFCQQNRRPTDTSSLLKMRVYKEIICPQKRNNGLQDPDNIQKMLEVLKDPTSRKGLEYLANLSKKKSIVKLNGIQNSNEIPEDMQLRPPAEAPPQLLQKRISANGLANRRNPNNPPLCILRPQRADEPLMMEYPRQKQNARNCYSMQAEKENGTVATLQKHSALPHMQNAHGSIPYDRQSIPVMAQGYHGNNDVIRQYGESAPPPRYCHQMQPYYLNGSNLPGHNGGQGDVAYMQRVNAPGGTRIDRAGGDTGEKPNAEEATKRMGDARAMQATYAYGQPEIRETRTIGGITYLARKPEYALNNLAVSPDKLITSGHVQAPGIF